MYQSGCEPAPTCDGLYGPYSHTGLIWTSAAQPRGDSEDGEEEAAGLRHEAGRSGAPTTLCSCGAAPGHWVCFWCHMSSRCAVISASRMPGTSRMWIVNSRGMKSVPGELPAEHERAQIGADDRDRLDDAVGDPQAGAGEQVVRQRVAGEAFEKAERDAVRRR